MALDLILRPTAMGFYDSANWILAAGASKPAAVDPGPTLAHDDLTSYLQIFRANTNRISFLLTGIRPAMAAVVSVTGFCRWRNINNYNAAQTLGLFTRRLGADGAELTLTGGGDGVGNFTTLSGAIPSAGGGPWTPTDIADGGLELGMYPPSWQPTNPNEIDGTSLWMVVSYEPVAEQIGQAREAASRKLWAFARANPILDTAVPLSFLDAELGDEVFVSDYALPLQQALGDGSLPWQRPLFRKGREEINLSDSSMSATLRGLRAHLVTFVDMGHAKTGGPQADGVLRLDVGNTRSFTRSTKAYVPDPSDGIIRELQEAQEKLYGTGYLHERGSTNGFTRSSFISQLTGWTTVGSVSAVAAADNQPFFEAGVTGWVAKISSSAIGDRGPTSPASTSYSANSRVSVSLDYREGEADTALKLRITRGVDGWFYNGTTWQAGTFDLALPASLVNARAAFEDIDVGSNATTIIARPVILISSGKTAYIGHVQVEGQRWASASRIVTDATTASRAIDSLAISNASPKYAWNREQGSGIAKYTRKYGNADSGDFFYLIDLPYDGNNGFALFIRNSTQELVFAVKTASVTVEATIPWVPTRDTAERIAWRWCSSQGELGLAPYTVAVFALGVKGTDAVAAAMPTQADTNMSIGTDSGKTWSADGVLEDLVITQQVLTDAELARGGP